MEDVSKDSLESAFLDLSNLCHGGIGWLRLNLKNNTSEVSMLWLVGKTMGLEEVVREPDVRNP